MPQALLVNLIEVLAMKKSHFPKPILLVRQPVLRLLGVLFLPIFWMLKLNLCRGGSILYILILNGDFFTGLSIYMHIPIKRELDP
jgi:hypothetical protein